MKKFLAVVLEMTMNAMAKIAFSCKRMARHGIAFPFRAVIGLAALSLLDCVALGQVVVSGPAVLSGNVQLGSGLGSAPLTYSARTDNCVTGSESGCVGGRTTGEAGATLAFQMGPSDPLPFLRLDDGTSPAVANTSFTDSDFGSYSIFATDQTTSTATQRYGLNSDGGYDAFALPWLRPSDVMLVVVDQGGTSHLLHVNETRFLAHACSTTNKCVIPSNVVGTNCTPSATTYTAPYCTHTHVNNGGLSFSRNYNDPPNTFYEVNLPQIYKDTWTTGSTPGTNDSVSRTLYVDFSSDSGGAIPCSIVPSDYNSTWQGVLTISNTGGITLASAGGGSYQSLGSGAQAVTLDTFIMPVNNLIGGNGTWMFQATTPGNTSGTEPLWGTNCTTQGTTCSDGTAVWTNIGKVTGQGPGFDLLHFDPTTGTTGSGCSYINTRRARMKRGTNEGTSWPSSGGTAGASGQLITDDAVTCYRMGGSSCGTGGTVNFTDLYTLHGADQTMQPRYSGSSPTGAGAKNNNYTGGGGSYPTIASGPNGSCADNRAYTNFASWPNTMFVPGNSYTNGKAVSSQSPPNGDNNYYKLTGTTGTYSTDPSLDSANWVVEDYYCYNYYFDWYSNLVRALDDVGPGYNGGGHAGGGYAISYRGGILLTVNFFEPQCNTVNGNAWPGNFPLNPPPPYCNYIGAPYPGVKTLTTSLPSDNHPSGRNHDSTDLQPMFGFADPVPGWGGVGLSGTPYSAAGYAEVFASSTNGDQTLWRIAHTYCSGSNPFFDVQDCIGVVSADGKMYVVGSDAMNTRGDASSGSATCAHPLRAQYQPSAGGTVHLNDYVLPVGNNTGSNIFQATTCAGGTCTEGATLPNWTSCTTTCTDGGVTWTNQGPNTCRSDIILTDPTSAHPATGATINAASCSYTDVNNAITAANPGDTVNVPAGTCTYPTNTANTPTVTINKAITVQGQTTCTGRASTLSCTDNTIITDNTGTGADEVPFAITASNARLSGITIIGGVTGDYKFLIETAKNITGWRIDHSHLHPSISTVGGIQAMGFGLIDHNYFTDANTLVAGQGDDSRDGTNNGDYNWSQPLNAGTGNELYEEDNEFANTSGTVLNGIDNYDGAKWVFRFNDMQNTNIANHGLDSTSNGRSTLLSEIYNNTFSNSGTHIDQFYVTRGGVTYIFGNNISAAGGSYDVFTDLREYRADSAFTWGICNGSDIIDQNTTGQSGWACRDQVGRGPETAPATDWPVNTSSPAFSEASFPHYSFNNTWKGAAPTVANTQTCNSSGTCPISQITVNRDYYVEDATHCVPGGGCTQGTASGTWANRPTTCTVGTGYWATDQGSWNISGSGGQGVLYKCTSTNNWTLYYTPYTYPHPLQ